MDTKEFREFGKATIDLIADYVDNIRDRDVLPSVEPGYLIKKLPDNAPEKPEDWKIVLKDFSDTILPGITNWQSPHFHGYYPTGSSLASTVGGMLSDGLGILGITWITKSAVAFSMFYPVFIMFVKGRTKHLMMNVTVIFTLGRGNTTYDAGLMGSFYSLLKTAVIAHQEYIKGNIIFILKLLGKNIMASPACTELEVVTMNWLGKMIGLPEEFLNCSSGPGGGIIQGSASEATLVGLLAAKDKTIRRLKKNNPSLDDDDIRSKFIAYTSDQCNSSVEKAGALGSMKMRLLKADPHGRLRGETLQKAFEEDKAKGLIPCYVVANLGTTGTCAFDPLYELGPVCQKENVWLHVDAAYAGSAFICPEYRHLMRGVEYADSFDVNVHKWMLVTFDCSAMWVKDGYDLVNAFDVQRIYLDDVKSAVKIPDYRHWQMPLGRRFRSLKLWTVMKIYGAEGLQSHIRNQISLANHFAKLVSMDNRFIIEPEPSMALVCFRLEGGDNLTKQLLDNLVEKKKVFMVAGKYRNRLVIRFVVCSRLTTTEDIEISWNTIKEETNLICKDNIQMKPKSIPTIDHLETITLCEKSK